MSSRMYNPQTTLHLTVTEVNEINALQARDTAKPVKKDERFDLLYCPSCDEVTLGNYKFCPYCGQRIDTTVTAL